MAAGGRGNPHASEIVHLTCLFKTVGYYSPVVGTNNTNPKKGRCTTNNTNPKTTRVFYTYRSPDNINLPACVETNEPRDVAIQIVRGSFNRFGACRLVAIRPAFTNRNEVVAEITAVETELSSVRMTVIADKIPVMADLRNDLRDRLAQLQRELGEW